ncbi:hypothetical protein JW890_08785 [candidate division WOR-3 bacterium]|nr:hypothetical protein [candidate division WOR-3 bacterium]
MMKLKKMNKDGSGFSEIDIIRKFTQLNQGLRDLERLQKRLYEDSEFVSLLKEISRLDTCAAKKAAAEESFSEKENEKGNLIKKLEENPFFREFKESLAVLENKWETLNKELLGE